MTHNRNRTIGLLATVLLHALILVFWIHKAQVHRNPPSTGVVHEVEVTLLPTQKAEDDDTKMVEAKTSADGYSGKDGKAKAERTCDRIKNKKYMGIGIVYKPSTGVVLQAPPSYPAYRAGIRVGDKTLMFIPSEDGHLLVDLDRKGQRFSLYIKPELICFIEEKP